MAVAAFGNFACVSTATVTAADAAVAVIAAADTANMGCANAFTCIVEWVTDPTSIHEMRQVKGIEIVVTLFASTFCPYSRKLTLAALHLSWE